MKYHPLLILMFLMIGCSGGSSGKTPNTVETVPSLFIDRPFFTTGLITVLDEIQVDEGQYENDGSSNISVTFEWAVDGVVVPQTSSVLPAGVAKKGQLVEVRQIVNDGRGFGISEVISLVVADSEGTLAVDFPKGIENQEYHFKAVLEDADLPGGKGAALVAYAPEGLIIDNNGNGVWAPSKIYFPGQTYRLGLYNGDDTDSEIQEFSIAFDPSVWPKVYSSVQATRGASGLHETNLAIGDFNNNGLNEILSSDSEQSIFLMHYTDGEYEQSWMYPFFHPSIGQIVDLAGINIDNDNELEIIATGKGGVLIIDSLVSVGREIYLNQDSSEILNSKVFMSEGAPKILIVDVPQSQRPSKFSVINLLNGGLEFETMIDRSVFVNDIAVGNLDEDDSLEVTLNSGYVFDSSDWSLQWDFGEAFSNYLIENIDLDGDGIDEIVSGSSGSPGFGVSVFSVVEQKKIFSSNGEFGSVCSMTGSNVDGDIQEELILLRCSDNFPTAHDWANGSFVQKKWPRLPAQAEGRSILIGDSDNDGKAELHWSNAVSGQSLGFFNVADIDLSVQEKWTSDDQGFLDRFSGIGWANVNSTLDTAVFIAASETSNNIDGNRIVYVDEENNITLTEPYNVGNVGAQYLSGVIADFGGDGTSEVIMRNPSVGVDNIQMVVPFSSDSVWESSEGLGIQNIIKSVFFGNDTSIDFSYVVNEGIVVRDGSTFEELNNLQISLSVRDFSFNKESANSHLIAAIVVDDEAPNNPSLIELWRMSSENKFLSTIQGVTNDEFNRLEFGNFDSDEYVELVVVPLSGLGSMFSKISIYEIREDQLYLERDFEVVGSVVDFVVKKEGDKNHTIVAAITSGLATGSFFNSSWVSEISLTSGVLWQSPLLVGDFFSRSMAIKSDESQSLIFGTTEALYLLR